MHPGGRFLKQLKNALRFGVGRDVAGVKQRFVREMAQLLSQSRNGWVRQLAVFLTKYVSRQLSAANHKQDFCNDIGSSAPSG